MSFESLIESLDAQINSMEERAKFHLTLADPKTDTPDHLTMVFSDLLRRVWGETTWSAHFGTGEVSQSNYAPCIIFRNNRPTGQQFLVNLKIDRYVEPFYVEYELHEISIWGERERLLSYEFEAACANILCSTTSEKCGSCLILDVYGDLERDDSSFNYTVRADQDRIIRLLEFIDSQV